MTRRVVFDCMVFVQAVARPNGPAAACVDKAADGTCELVVSDRVLDEVRDVIGRPKLRRTFLRATDEDIEAFLARVAAFAVRIDPVPGVFTLARDPKDSMYLNLAAAAEAELVVSRDNDLLDLMTGTDADATAFRAAFPHIGILDPVAFLRTLRAGPPAAPEEAP